ncbi:MAG TPA: LPS export ABC transporter permease LptG [Micropepsaceae bacterium]|jgi:lipopolysaccharide export system permease protein|nr:LPS export ABC transporter permease LptG [Micropepsaceae bacterium]
MTWSLTLTGYLAKRFFLAVFMVFMAFSALALSIDLADLFSRTTERGIPPEMVISMSLLKLPDIAQKLMPFAILLGAVFAFSRMSRSHELVATRAAGISAWQFLTPPLLVAVALGVLTMTLFNPMASAFLTQYTRLEARYIHGQASQLAVSSTGLWLRQGDASHQSVVHALRVADQGVHLEEVIVFLYQGLDHYAGRIDAASGELQAGHWHLTNAWVSGANGLPQHHDVYDLPTELTPAQIQESFASPDTISFWELPRFISNAEGAGFSALRHRLYWYSLLSLPVLFCAMVFMAASFSLRLARLGGTPRLVLAALLSGFGVYFLGDVTGALGQSGILPTPLAALAPAAAATLLGMTLLFHEEDG